MERNIRIRRLCILAQKLRRYSRYSSRLSSTRPCALTGVWQLRAHVVNSIGPVLQNRKLAVFEQQPHIVENQAGNHDELRPIAASSEPVMQDPEVRLDLLKDLLLKRDRVDRDVTLRQPVGGGTQG